jgi:hypothetical protein
MCGMSMNQPVSPSTPLTAEQEAPATRRRPALLLAIAAGLCWACAIAMLISTRLEAERDLLAPVRIMFYLLVLAAGLLTFAPIQRQLQLPGLTLEGVGGAFLLLYAIAFVPPPTGWLLALPDTPVYVLFGAALFWTSSALALPLIYVLGQRMFRRRARKYDRRRARRQAHECGFLLTAYAALAALRLLTPPFALLLLLIIIVAEILFLSFVKTEH